MPYHIHTHKKHKTSSHHIPAMFEGLGRILQRPLTNFFIILVLTFATFLPSSFYALWKNVTALDNVWNQASEITVYLKKSVSAKTATTIAEQLKSNNAVMELKLISPDEGIQDFTKHTGFGEILLGVKENPLPYVIVIYPKASTLTEDQILALVDGLKNLPEVETTKIDIDWVTRSHRLLILWEHLSMVLALLFSIGALVTICFTAYTTPQIITHETDVSKRVLQYQCFWLSFISGLLAIALIKFILIQLHNLGFVLQGLETNQSIILILAEVLLGIISSKFALKKHSFAQEK